MMGGPANRGRRRARRWLRICSWSSATVLLLATAMQAHVQASAAGRVVSADAAPGCDLLIVPGARIHADGTPYGMLRDRLETAAILWRAGKAPRILLSGNGTGDRAADEVAAMRRYLLARSIPAAALVEDPQGLRTIDTMDRAHAVYGARSAIVVSNDFHVARAVFLGANCGLDVVGVAALPLQDYSTRTVTWNRGREMVARVVAWLDVFAFGTRGLGCAGRSAR